MYKKLSIFIVAFTLFYGCNGTDDGAVQSIADLEQRVIEINSMNAELEQQKNDLYTLIRQFNADLPEAKQFDITFMDTLMGTSERELLRAMFREEKDISYNGLLKMIIAKNDEIGELQQNLSEMEAILPKPYTVKRGDTHYNIAMQYLMANHGLTRSNAHKIIWQTALIDDILPGNRIWLMYDQNILGSFVTQGDAKISPMKVMMMARKRISENAKIISSVENSEKNIVIN